MTRSQRRIREAWETYLLKTATERLTSSSQGMLSVFVLRAKVCYQCSFFSPDFDY